MRAGNEGVALAGRLDPIPSVLFAIVRSVPVVVGVGILREPYLKGAMLDGQNPRDVDFHRDVDACAKRKKRRL